ncbi:MAG: chorismate synthase [Anaerovorax sp.]|nr:chorismate synthase [Anaerovorax sp.]
MSGVWGKQLELSIFGESHGNGIGMVINGLPSGFAIDIEEINREMQRRAPGKDNFSTTRNEQDLPQILSGIFKGKTTGTPLCCFITNKDNHSSDYSLMEQVMRPGHGDYPGFIRYQGANDYRGGGHFSGRLTAPLVFCGAICKQILKEKGIYIGAHIKQIGNVRDISFNLGSITREMLSDLTKETFPVLDQNKVVCMQEEILSVKSEGDSVGGIVECAAIGLPAGIGDPFFDSVESTLAHLLFSIPAIKGVEFGLGFEMAEKKGSECNDSYYYEGDQVKAKTNYNGGILGGITNGMPIVFRSVIKPTPSISKEQATINIKTQQNTTLSISGRHDACIVQRALPVIEAVCAIGIYECMKRRDTDGIGK